jgi:hypothetical protein
MGIREQKTFEIKLREGGNLIIPKFLRDALRQQMRGLLKEHGVTAEDLLHDLRSRTSRTATSS